MSPRSHELLARAREGVAGAQLLVAGGHAATPGRSAERFVAAVERLAS